MKSVLGRAALGLALLAGVATARPTEVSAQNGGELAVLCQDPDFRQLASSLLDLPPMNTVGQCVSLVQLTLQANPQRARLASVACQNPTFRQELGVSNVGRCVDLILKNPCLCVAPEPDLTVYVRPILEA